MMIGAISPAVSAANTAAMISNMSDTSTGIIGMASAGQVGSMSAVQIDKVSQDFESMFLGQMLEQMFGDSVGEDAFGNSDTKDVYKGLMMDEYSKMITKSGGIGIADYVKQELLKLQEK